MLTSHTQSNVKSKYKVHMRLLVPRGSSSCSEERTFSHLNRSFIVRKEKVNWMNGFFIVLFWLSLFFNWKRVSWGISQTALIWHKYVYPVNRGLPLGKGSLQLSINMAQLDVRPGPSGLSVHASITVAVNIAGNEWQFWFYTKEAKKETSTTRKLAKECGQV